ncbi:hypothetical protein MLD38_038932 [Melastoma candidum]|uniref:Uncharacterized protein n=1 Tax=Melastoma candidum TaxID=119954 RepID=A0ACB9L2S4_9MYRT|nr:hypothetical protein MLD38_038932 [Melastoma candidum]
MGQSSRKFHLRNEVSGIARGCCLQVGHSYLVSISWVVLEKPEASPPERVLSRPQCARPVSILVLSVLHLLHVRPDQLPEQYPEGIKPTVLHRDVNSSLAARGQVHDDRGTKTEELGQELSLLNLDSKGTWCRQKAVLVLVYEEMPRGCRRINHHGPPSKNWAVLHRRRSHSGKGYSRKAELLKYSQRLRESARSGTPTPLPPNNHQSTDKVINKKKAVALHEKQKHKQNPACFWGWFPGFSGSSTKEYRKKRTRSRSSSGTKMSQVMKSMGVNKKRSSWWKLLSALKKGR